MARGGAVFFFFLLSLICLTCPVRGHPHATGYDYGFDAATLVKRQTPSQRFIVKGANRPNTSEIPLRPNLRDLEKDHERWNLYILAMSMLEFTNQSEQLSWYQISGIHGVPFQPWGDVQATPGNEQTGYCSHESILFPTWHRPYLALYEQVLYELVQHISSWYKDPNTRKRHQDAAADFRIPYWDWAARPPTGESLLPPSVGSNPWIEISGPNGKQMISNPLYMYPFRPLNASAFYMDPWDKWDTTLRSPSSSDRGAQSNNSKVATVLDRNQAMIQQRVYALFSNYDNYTEFSNEAWYPKNSKDQRHDSVEAVHDTVHSLAGLGGHMTFIPFSSFDPIFWLHHTNLDRLVAMWQILYPDTWVTPQPARMSSFTVSTGQIQDSQTPLTPFYSDPDGTFWTSDDVRTTEVFGYRYAETAFAASVSSDGSKMDLGEEQRRVLKASINRLYGESSPARLGYDDGHRNKRKRNLKSSGVSHPRVALGNAWWSSTSPDPAPGRVLVEGEKQKSYRDWTVNVQAEKQALRGTYFIHVFGGEPPADLAGWASASNLIGTMSVFASPGAYGDHMPEGNLVSGTIPLTSYLTCRVVEGGLASLDIGDAEPYLREKLQYRIILPDDTAVDAAAVPNLRLAIVSSVVKAPESEFELPQWGETMSHFDMK